MVRDDKRVEAHLLRVPSPGSQLRSADDGPSISQKMERSHAGQYPGVPLDQRLIVPTAMPRSHGRSTPCLMASSTGVMTTSVSSPVGDQAAIGHIAVTRSRLEAETD